MHDAHVRSSSLPLFLSRYSISYRPAGGWGILVESVVICASAAYGGEAGYIVAFLLASTGSAVRGRATLSGNGARPSGQIRLGTTEFERCDVGKWCHLTPVYARALDTPPPVVGHSRTHALAHLWLFPRPLQECLSIYDAACGIQCRVLSAHGLAEVAFQSGNETGPRMTQSVRVTLWQERPPRYGLSKEMEPSVVYGSHQSWLTRRPRAWLPLRLLTMGVSVDLSLLLGICIEADGVLRSCLQSTHKKGGPAGGNV